jgi:site-specific recombinase XerD
VSEIYLKEKSKELRKDSMRCYTSFSNIFLSWINRTTPTLYCSLFNKSQAIRFLDYIYNERNVSARTYNDYLKLSRCFFEWAVEKGYCKENPFLRIKMKKKTTKERTIIDVANRKRIAEHLKGKPFLLVCMLVYHSLIRPKEIRNLKIGDIDMAGHCIKVSGEIAKNHKTRYAAISAQIEKAGKKPLSKGLWNVFYASYVIESRKVLFKDVQDKIDHKKKIAAAQWAPLKGLSDKLHSDEDKTKIKPSKKGKRNP